MSTRTRKEEKNYYLHRKEIHSKTDCIFCDYTSKDESFISETKSFKIIDNIFPYTQWDGQGVLDHIMIVPKKHTDTLSDLTSYEAIEYVELVSSYESRGYSVYSRAQNSTRKTVAHQHTHLIKLDDQTKKFVFYLRKPFIRIVK
jgi:diadenosine tetraphosphate (Ap4A) HIT family hydrolase